MEIQRFDEFLGWRKRDIGPKFTNVTLKHQAGEEDWYKFSFEGPLSGELAQDIKSEFHLQPNRVHSYEDMAQINLPGEEMMTIDNIKAKLNQISEQPGEDSWSIVR